MTERRFEQAVEASGEQLGRQIVAVYQQVRPGELEFLQATVPSDPIRVNQLIEQTLRELSTRLRGYRFVVHEYRGPLRLGGGRKISQIVWSENSRGEQASPWYYIILLPHDDPRQEIPDDQRLIRLSGGQTTTIGPVGRPLLSTTEALTPIEPEHPTRYSAQVLKDGELTRIEAESLEKLQIFLHQHFVLDTLRDAEVQTRGWNVSANVVLSGLQCHVDIELRDRRNGNVMDVQKLRFKVDEVIEG